MIAIDGLTGKPESREYPHGIQALKKALNRALKQLDNKGKKK